MSQNNDNEEVFIGQRYVALPVSVIAGAALYVLTTVPGGIYLFTNMQHQVSTSQAEIQELKQRMTVIEGNNERFARIETQIFQINKSLDRLLNERNYRDYPNP